MTAVNTTADVTIKSELCRFPNPAGAMVSAYIDRPATESDDRQIVIMVPKYAETKKNNLQLAYYLAANGLTVLRFDFTNHFGESEGDMLDFTLPGSVADIISALDFVQEKFGVVKSTVIASSLSSLPAFRAAAEDERIDHLVGIVPVMDFRYTIDKIYQEDLIGNYQLGHRHGVLDIMGHDVNMDNFCPVTIGANMHDLQGTLESVRKIKCPISLFPAAEDVWISMEDVNTVAAANPRIRIRPIEGAMHEVRENKSAADQMMREVIATCWTRSYGEPFDEAAFVEPDMKMLFGQNRIERDRLREACPVTDKEDQFWGKYLGKYGIMEKIDGYQEYLDLVGAQLGEVKDGEILLDAGCGNGLFGVWILRELIQRKKSAFDVPPVYFGMDLTDEGLNDAVAKHAAANQILKATSKRGDGPQIVYSRVDLDKFGPEENKTGEVPCFEENCFDKIACSLLLSYLVYPEPLLVHLHRLLRPKGKIVISSMKPFSDLSAIYRDFVDQKAAKSDVVSARELLRAAGAIQIKLEQGYYNFFSEEEMTGMLKNAGFKGIESFPSFGNQAIVLAATK